MGAWMLPSAAAAFALGLLCGSSMPGWVGPRIAFSVGLLALGSGWFVAGRERRGPEPLVRADLLPEDHAAIEEVAGHRVSSALTPAVAAVLSLAGVLVLGAGGFFLLRKLRQYRSLRYRSSVTSTPWKASILFPCGRRTTSPIERFQKICENASSRGPPGVCR